MNTTKPVLLFSLLKEKDGNKMVNLLGEVNWEKVIITRVQGDRGMETAELFQLFQEKLVLENKCLIIEDNQDAYLYGDGIKGKGTLFCTGSLYLIGDLKKIVEEEND